MVFIQAGDSLTVLVVTISMQDEHCKMHDQGSCLFGCLVIIVSNTVYFPQPLSLQLGCNQGTHSMVKTTNLFFQ